jgi:transposase InsO family protein
MVGWTLADHMRTELVEDALRMAFIQRQPLAGLIFHSDRGSPAQVQRVVATLLCQAESRSSSSASAGVFQPRVFRGRVLGPARIGDHPPVAGLARF